MEFKTKKIIRYDYILNMLEVLLVFFVIFAALAFAGDMSSGGVIFIALFLADLLIIIMRTLSIKKKIKLWKNYEVNGTLDTIHKNRGNLQVFVSYMVNENTYSQRWYLLGGFLLVKKLEKLDSISLLYNPDKPKKAIVVELYKN